MRTGEPEADSFVKRTGGATLAALDWNRGLGKPCHLLFPLPFSVAGWHGEPPSVISGSSVTLTHRVTTARKLLRP
jgi:hypothetical protein